MAHRSGKVISRAAAAVSVLRRYARVAGAFLFGSQVDGGARPDSDIDVAAFVEGAEDWGICKRVEVSCLVQEQAGDDIEIHFFPAMSLDHSEPASFAAYVQKHGVRIKVETPH